MHPTVEPRGGFNPTDGYINMAALNLEKTTSRNKPEKASSSDWYVTMESMENEETVEMAKNKKAKRRSANPKQLSADVRNDFLQQMKTSNRHKKVPELQLPTEPVIKEQVTILKDSPTSTPKAKLKSVKSAPYDGRWEISEVDGAGNISPGFDGENKQHSYMNFTPGKFFAEPGSPTRQAQSEYMNIDFEKQDSSSMEKQKNSRHDYVNVDLRKRDSNPDAREYMNFTPGQMLSKRESEGPSKEIPEMRRDILSTSVKQSENSNWLMVDFAAAEKTERSLNYVSLDLSHRDTSNGVTKPRIQPFANKSVGTSTGNSSYVEVDFTKSQGLKQVLQEKERSESFVENLI